MENYLYIFSGNTKGLWHILLNPYQRLLAMWQRSQYPAVLVAQLAVFDGFGGKDIGKEVLDFIKSWFINPLNKTGCRYVVVDAVNTPKVLQFYLDNGFDFIFSSDEEEMKYMSDVEKVEDGDVFRETRLMVFDLMTIKSNK